MVSVLQVYTALKDLANKEQKGFITPQVFNSFAPIAQMNIYNELFSELVDAKRISRQNFDPGRNLSVRKQRLEDLSFFYRKELIQASNGLAEKPLDLSKVISISVSDLRKPGDTDLDFVNCEVVYNPEKMDYILGNNLSSPTEDFPVALVSNVDIEVFPSGLGNIALSYYAKPTSFTYSNDISPLPPYYGYTVATIGSEEVDVFQPENSRNFMLPPHYVGELVMEMAKLTGIRLRDANVVGFATNEEASE